MGLYDTPLPPRPPRKDDDDEEIEIIETTSLRLFSFDENGKEVNNLLPSLGRRLTSGIDCYFEASDRIVVNLVDKTNCNVQDACWALEACKGDVTEAWTSISTARRLLLNRERADALAGEDDDEDSIEIETEEAFSQQKLQRELEDRERRKFKPKDMLSGQPDQQWLPKANPKPIDDEPWFTG